VDIVQWPEQDVDVLLEWGGLVPPPAVSITIPSLTLRISYQKTCKGLDIGAGGHVATNYATATIFKRGTTDQIPVKRLKVSIKYDSPFLRSMPQAEATGASTVTASEQIRYFAVGESTDKICAGFAITAEFELDDGSVYTRSAHTRSR
jgi:hypothetical protein